MLLTTVVVASTLAWGAVDLALGEDDHSASEGARATPAGSVASRAAGSPKGSDAPSLGAPFIRRAEQPDGEVTLRIVSRRYRHPDRSEEVTLTGVAHLGTRAYYEALQRHLDAHVKVLYESVMPRGAAASPGSDPVQVTRDRMLFLRSVMVALRDAERSAGREDRWPTIEETLARAHEVDGRFAPWVRGAANDAWGRAISVETGDDGAFLLLSLGADGEPGGIDADADIRLRTPRERRASRSREEALQPQLAAMLGMAFQLDAMDYHRPHWVVADMDERQLVEELATRGVDGAPFVGAVGGAGAVASVAGAAVALVRIADAMSGGRVRAFVTLLMIETLSAVDESTLSRGMPSGFMEVILDRRNDVAWEALMRTLDGGAPPKSVAVFYGAAHMPDLERRLAAAGWMPASEEWFDAMSLNPRRAGLDPATVEEMRRMLSQLMNEMGAGEGAR
ncbi:MAG: type II secretion system protein GspG [Phycisphaeraceae bacterium]|nr:type II secretion system protein GspG [Phycisphaeraceae bacterium]